MKRVMVWMWLHEVQTTDERGRPTKRQELSDVPVEGGKRVRVAYYRPSVGGRG